MARTVGANGDNVQAAGLVGTQVNANDIHTRAHAGRLTKQLHSLKGLLTREVNFCNKKIAHFRTLMASTQQRTPVFMTEYARGLLECHTHCKTKYERVEKGFADLQALETETWEGDDEELDEYLIRMDTESEACFNQFSEVQHSNIEIFEKCLTLTLDPQPDRHRLRLASQQWVSNIRQI